MENFCQIPQTVCENSYSIFTPEYKAPETSVTGINLETAFNTSLNGIQNMAYVNGTTEQANKVQQEYYDSMVNQYKYTFNRQPTEAEQKVYQDGTCYKELSKCKFLEVNKDFKSAKVENGEIVIVREISDGTIYKGEGDPNYTLMGGYVSGKKDDVIRVSLTTMGQVIKSPKDLFSQWANEDYNSIADNLGNAANELFNSFGNDAKLVNNGITESYERGQRFYKHALALAENEVAKEELVKDILIAYFTGGGSAGIKQMVKDKIRDALIEKAAEATGIDPTLVRLAMGKFDQAKMSKKMTKSFGGSKALANMGSQLLNNPFLQSATAVIGTMLGGPLTGVMLNKGIASTSLVENNNKLNELKQQERGLIQDAVGSTVAQAIGLPPESASYISQYFGGVMKRKEQKRNNRRIDRVVSNGLATGLNMVSGMVNGITRNAIIAFGGSGKVYDELTARPFTPTATWTGAQKIDTSKEGLIDRAQEYAFEQLLIANGMDADLAKTVSSTTNGKIKAKKEEKISAIESTVQTALAVTAIAVTGGAAGPALGSVLTGGAGTTFYAVQGTSIALQAAIGSRKGGAEGALAGAMNGALQAVAATNFGKLAEGADKLKGMADEIQTMAINNPLLAKTLAATNISYSKEDGWGVKANVSGVVQSLGVTNYLDFNRFTNVTIGQSQHGGASLNLGVKTSIGTFGATYTGSSGDWEGSYDLIERSYNGINVSSEISIGKDGVTVSGEMDFGNGYGLGIENGKSGVSSSLTILGSQQGSVDRYGNYTPNENFLGEINGQDIIDLLKSQQQSSESADAENPNDGEEGPQGLVDLAFATGAMAMSGLAAWAAGGSGSSAPSGGSSAGNGGNTVIGRRPEDKVEGGAGGGKEGLDADGGDGGGFGIDGIGAGLGLLAGVKLGNEDSPAMTAESAIDKAKEIANEKEKKIADENKKKSREYVSSDELNKIYFDYPANDKAKQFERGIDKLNKEISDIEKNTIAKKEELERLKHTEGKDDLKTLVAKEELDKLISERLQLLEVNKEIERLVRSGVDPKDIQFSQRRKDALNAIDSSLRSMDYGSPLNSQSSYAKDFYASTNLDSEGYDRIADKDGIERIIVRTEEGEKRIEIAADGVINRIEQDGKGMLYKLFGDLTTTTTINEIELEDGGLIIRQSNGELQVVNPPSTWETVQSRVASLLKLAKIEVQVPETDMEKALAKLKENGKQTLWAQNGMDNLGIDAVNMNDGAKIASGNSGTEYGATVSVYNATNTFFGDLLKMKIGSLANRLLKSSGLEAADRTWDRIIQSGALDNGGRIIGHSQGAYIVTQAIDRNVDLDKNKPLEMELILAGGAQSKQVADRVKTVRNLRNATDNIPTAASVFAPLTLDYVEGSNLDVTIGTIGNAVSGKLKIKDLPLNYQLIKQDPDNSGFPLWGGFHIDDKYNDYVNGSGHSFLQYMNAIQYSDTLVQKEVAK